MNLIHALYLQGKRLQNINNNAYATTTALNEEEEAMLLASPMEKKNYLWMKQTIFKNTQLMNVQVMLCFVV